MRVGGTRSLLLPLLLLPSFPRAGSVVVLVVVVRQGGRRETFLL